MRFNYLNLRAFGHFTDYEIVFDPSKNFHLIYGLNEAGKSTALRSINHFLYGFPQQTTDSFLHDNKKLRIEGELQNSKGDTFRYLRRKGNKNTVIDSNGEPLNEALLDDFLHGISEKQFTNMFALNHVSLREGGESLLKSGGHLGESLFSAASGISILRKVFEELEKNSAELYKKRGSTPELNKLLKEEKEIKKEIAEYQLKVQAWKELEKKYYNGKKEIENLINEVKALRSEREKLQRVKLSLPKIAKLRELAKKLADLGEVPTLPDNIEELRKESLQILEIAKNKKKTAEESCHDIEKERIGITIPEGILEQAALIDSLYRELQSYQNHVKQLPSLEGERKHLEGRVISLMKDIDASHACLEHIDRYRLPAEKKENIRLLCRQKPLLDRDFEQNNREREEIQKELQEKEEQLGLLADLPNIELLEAVIDAVKREGKLEEAIKNRLIENEQTELQIKDEVKGLPQWDGTYEELMKIKVPGLKETIKKFEQEHNDLLQKLQKTREQITIQKEAIEGHEGRIRDLESILEIPSEEKLAFARNRRDDGWKLIRTKLNGEAEEAQLKHFADGKEIETAYEESVREADSIADIMRMEAAKVGEKNKLISDIESCKKKISELEAEENSLLAQIEHWETAWENLWQPTTIIPLTPEEMREWIAKYEHIKDLVQKYVKEKAAIHELEIKKLYFKEKLISEISNFVKVTEEKTLDELLTIAELQQKKINEALNKRKNLKDSISGINQKINNIAIKNKEMNRKLNEWKEAWLKAIQGTNISESTSVQVVENLLEKYESCAQCYEQLKEIEKEQELIQEQISLYEANVDQLLQSIAIKIDEKAVDIVVNKLHAKFQQAKLDQAKITDLNNQLKKLETSMKEEANKIEAANNVLTNLMKQANCSNIEELEKVEKTFALKNEYEEKIRVIEEELLDMGGGLSIQDLTHEAELYAYDRIGVELEEINRKLTEIEPVRSELEQAHGVVKKEFEEKIQGNNTASVAAEQKKESLLAKIAHLTDQYIQVKLASTLLQKGIEHYRNQNQDPILKRASELFSRLTLQSFTALDIDYDEKDEPVLVGVRANGDNVDIDGMSDGTTDQLYLSLRIASIEKYCNENESIPFIVDDILVHFDDIRSKETLKILLELSQQTQIIFFTHHARLIELMQELASENEYQLTELTSKDTVIV